MNKYPFTLEKLPYAYDALEPIIDQTDQDDDGRSPKQGKQTRRHPRDKTVKTTKHSQPERSVYGQTAPAGHGSEMDAPFVRTLDKSESYS